MTPYRADEVRGYYAYEFFSRTPGWHALDRRAKERAARRFADRLQESLPGVSPFVYSLQGLRSDREILLWAWGDSLEGISGFVRPLLEPPVAPHLSLVETRLATRRVSVYTGTEESPPWPSRRYLFVYPFVRTRAWYQLPAEERGRLMQGHIAAGRAFPGVIIHTGYSFGLDDQDFYLAFETDSVGEFQSLLMTMRELPITLHTQRDTPMYVGLRRTPEEVVDELIGPASPPEGPSPPAST
jgi:chlorite dismutase